MGGFFPLFFEERKHSINEAFIQNSEYSIGLLAVKFVLQVYAELFVLVAMYLLQSSNLLGVVF